MKQIPSDKYSIAWFTLAECVSRGEKIRALGLYRLLSHSLDDPAFTSQLKGDLLLAFQDDKAIDLYQEAAELYMKNNRILEAVAVYEHLLTLQPKKQLYIKELTKLYKKLGIQSKVVNYLLCLFDLVLATNDLPSALEIVEQLDEIANQSLVDIHRSFVLFLLKQEDPPTQTIVKYGKKVIDQLIDTANDKTLQQFLTTIEAINNQCYRELSKYLESLLYDSKKQ